jgi:hypothetical protein
MAVEVLMWKYCCVMKSKMFAWLLLSDRLNTGDLLQRRYWNGTEDTDCVLCPLRSHEVRIHLFFECNQLQNMELSIEWHQHDDLQIVLEHAKRSFGHSFFMEVIIIACWNIWLIRNGKIFRQKNGSFTMWKCMTYLCYGIESRSSTSIIS